MSEKKLIIFSGDLGVIYPVTFIAASRCVPEWTVFTSRTAFWDDIVSTEGVWLLHWEYC